jgi:hypothetical protein
MSANIQRSQSINVDSKGVISTIKKLHLTTRLKKQKSTNSETHESNNSLDGKNSNHQTSNNNNKNKNLLFRQSSVPAQQQNQIKLDEYDKHQNGKIQHATKFIRTLSSKFINKKSKQSIYETSDTKIDHSNTTDLIVNSINVDKVSLKSDNSYNTESKFNLIYSLI